jgi:hypothetical protein
VRFRGGIKVQRRAVELDGALVITFHLRLIRVLEHFPSAREGFLAHDLGM